MSGANESSPLCSLTSAQSTSLGPYSIMPQLIIGCLALHCADVASYQIHSGDLRPSTWQPVWQLILLGWGEGWGGITEIPSIPELGDEKLTSDGWRAGAFLITCISLNNYRYIFRICAPEKAPIFWNTNLIIAWQFRERLLVDSNLNIWEGPEGEPWSCETINKCLKQWPKHIRAFEPK